MSDDESEMSITFGEMLEEMAPDGRLRPEIKARMLEQQRRDSLRRKADDLICQFDSASRDDPEAIWEAWRAGLELISDHIDATNRR